MFLFVKTSRAQSLDVYQYVAGGHSGCNAQGSQQNGGTYGCPVGAIINDNNAQYPNLVVKKYGPPRFVLVTNTNTIVLGGGIGCEPGDTLADGCNVEEVWRTNATAAPALERPTGGNPFALVSRGWVNKLNADGKQCTYEYVLIDDDGTTNNREGFYLTTSTWTMSTVPSNITFCTDGYNPPSTTNTSIPVHCSPGPTSTMVVNSSFEIPRNGNLYLITKESIGVAGFISCVPKEEEPVETDFTGFLWKIDPSNPSCLSNATSSQRANCKMDSSDLTQNVRLRFYREDDSVNYIGEVYYKPGSTPPDYDLDNLLLDGQKVKICVALFQMIDPAGGDYTLAGAQMGTTNISVSGNCTSYFTPANYGGNNNVHLSFNYIPASYEPPWYTTINGDIYSGDSYTISNNGLPASNGTSFTNYTINDIGFALGDGGYPARYAESGLGATNFTDSSLWPTSGYPPTYPPTTPTLNIANYNLTEGVYNVTAGNLQTWLNNGSSYTVSGPNNTGLVILNVSGTATITVTKAFESGNSNSRLIIMGPGLSFNFQSQTASTFGESSPTASSNPNFDAGLIVGGSITFTKASTFVERSMLYNGFLVTNGVDKDITFNWTRGPSNAAHPSTIVKYDPGYILALQKLELAGLATGLTDFDLTWEVLD